jgi:hypothetical protein
MRQSDPKTAASKKLASILMKNALQSLILWQSGILYSNGNFIINGQGKFYNLNGRHKERKRSKSENRD